ncbi:type II toxin-antitoxin system RelE/ParE family toxin [Sphingomonas sp. 10B4]|uniref:type II toxin-antitoxin system RelE/ParE family toxin n=1 Tax=Sphingomonas sp. 10B4 TaxID=3048575 RepID=UPI002AB5A332|nr:type II toxin-antitoxin system RelE/ParE family toxin [Sphingomonas sp. 10B4]MDY7525145.1 type II toxin-antitoxin system RelE/ParE family toxin [Sphingomonas sp. 10B4]MEB0283269.1 type II toxin-antitoxin system RelE/ParE family toxin [Sphingomonas sp. 10B4]
MLPVVWTAEALDALDQIAAFIAARNLLAADRLQSLFEQAAERLPLHPYMYRSGRVSGTREAVVHPNYILVYQVGETAIDILAVLHTRQDYP